MRTHVSAVAFLDALPSVEAGCIITDVRMPGVDGIELLRRLASCNLNWPVIVMTGQADVALALEAIKLGLSISLKSRTDDETVLGAVRSALGGHATDTARDTERAEVHKRLAALSAVERQVFNGLIAGQPNKAIASELKIDLRAVEMHRASVMTRMQAKSLSHLVRMMLMAAP